MAAKKIDWLYFRKSCTTCKKAMAYLGEGIKVTTTVDATKERINPTQALELLDGVDKLIAAKGKAIHTINLKKDRPADEELTALLIGPTGNLRAPSAKVGKTMLVGFNEEAYQQVFG